MSNPTDDALRDGPPARPTPEPTIVQKRAIDVTPHHHGIWCSIQDGAPFVNPIVVRSWYEDGSRISFMLDSHNFDSAEPDELMDVVELVPSAASDLVAKWDEEDRKRMARRPIPQPICPACGHQPPAKIIETATE